MLLCNPFGEEASRAHRIYRVLATQLERAGYAALRFDYSGTGDSSGDSESATLDAWVEDVGAAVDRLQAISGATRIVAVGLRFGATLAMLASARGARLRHLVLWDPVIDGAQYLRELTAQHRAYMHEEVGAHWEDKQRISANGIPTEVLGAPLGNKLGDQIAALDLAAIAPASELMTVLATRGDLAPLRARLPQATKWIEMAESAAWNSDAALNAMTVPMDIVQAIVARIEETSP